MQCVSVPFPKEMKRPNTKIWTNLNAFMSVWYSPKAEAVYQHYAWTVKVNPYAVFVPQPLRSILAYQPVPSNGAYLEKKGPRGQESQRREKEREVEA